MAKLILHPIADTDAINERRTKEDLNLTADQRREKTLQLMKLVELFRPKTTKNK